jgi:cyclase
MTMKKLRDGIYADTDGMNGGNYGAIILDDEILMIDSGMIHTKSRTSKEFLESEIGLPIKKLIFTHSHSDHVFGAQSFEPVLLIASMPTRRQCQENLNSEWKHKNLLERYSQVKNEQPELWEALQNLVIRLPDIVFNGEIAIGSKRQVQARLTGGHTAGSSVVISHDNSTIFVGDLIFSGQFPYGGDSSCDPDRWIEALDEICKMEFKTIIPGHGPVCTQKDLADYYMALTELRHNVKAALQKGISIEDFVEMGMIPKTLNAGFERFGEVTLKHWFEHFS